MRKTSGLRIERGRFGAESPAPFLGFFFLLEDRESVHQPVANKEPHFPVDAVFQRQLASGQEAGKPVGISYAERYQLLCRRLVLERMYSAACLILATDEEHTRISQPASDLTFRRFVAALRGHAVMFLETARH